MRRLALAVLGSALAVLVVAGPAARAQAPSPKHLGSRAGTLKTGADEQELVQNIAPADSGGLQVYYDVPSENARGMRIPDPRIAGASISFPVGNGRYEATVNAAGTELAGKYTAGNGSEVPLTFTRRSATPVLPAVIAAIDDPDGYAGDFTGEIEAGGGLEATFHLRRTPDGYAATMDIPAQGALGLTADTVTLDGDVLTITFPFGTFTGSVEADRTRLDGTWTQSGRQIPFDLVRQ